MDVSSHQRNALIAGALMGAILGAGAAWLLVNNPADTGKTGIRKPIAPAELLKLTSRLAILVKDMNELRRRV